MSIWAYRAFLLQFPEAGKVVPGSGGVRKVRWAITGRGKCGGVRVVYYFKRREDEIWLLTIYKAKPKISPPIFCDNSQRRLKMSNRDIGQEILEGLREIKAYKAGEKTLKTRTLKEPAPVQVIRTRLNISQAAFAGLMGVSVRTVQDWEQGRRKPSGPAAALLRIAEQKPEIFLQLS